jgi:hypothetical protein
MGKGTLVIETVKTVADLMAWGGTIRVATPGKFTFPPSAAVI